MPLPAAKRILPQGSQLAVIKNIMGDKSPKANQKKSSQKQAVASLAEQKNKQAAAAKAAAGKKR